MIKNLQKEKEKISFETDMEISLANAVRRSVNEVQTLAVDTLEISKNDSALYDEIVAHRMGLAPLKHENLKLQEECSCKGKGCVKCTAKFKLSAKGPAVVYSTEITPKGSSVYKIPIAILDKNQELEFVAVAKVGKAIDHAKFSPGVIYYRYVDDVDAETLEKDDENFQKIIEESKKNKNKELLVSIESWGQMETKEIFIKAIEVLNKNIKELVKSIK
jgi:DNA-directed RNA polymerase subunit D